MATVLETVRLVAGLLFVLFAPGLTWSFAFFPRTRALDAPTDAGGIDWLERAALAFGISIVLVPVAVLFLNLGLRVPLNTATGVLIVLLLTAAPIPWILWKNPGLRRRLRRPRDQDESTETTRRGRPAVKNDAGGEERTRTRRPNDETR